jgi:hypothetical protein
MSWIAVSGPAATRKLPKLSSVPTGMAAGLIVMVRGCFCLVTTCEKPGGVGCEEQKRPVVTIAGMPYCRRSFCRVSGSRIDPGLMVSVAVPLALLDEGEGRGADRARAAGRGRAEGPGQAQAQHDCCGGRGGGDACG